MYEAVVIGVSQGGVHALKTLLAGLPADLPLAIIIVQHQGKVERGVLAELLDKHVTIAVKEAELNETISTGHVYLSCPGYHLLIEQDKSFSLSIDPPLNYSRPSIDILFQSAADAYRENLIGVILTGANADGSQGMATIKRGGGLTIVQDPATAEAATMPLAAIAATNIDHVLPLEDIGTFLTQVLNDNR